MSRNTAPSRLIVNLDAYAHNLGIVRQHIPSACSIMAVVKADAYGHGAVPVARRALAEGVRMLGVATVDEGAALRDAGVTAPVVVLLQPAAEALSHAVECNLRVTLSDVRTGERLAESAHRAGKLALVHCKVDCGMGRQGFPIETALEDILSLSRISNLDIEGIATHLATAEMENDDATGQELRRFRQFIKELDKQAIPYEYVHAARSGAIINYPNSAFNMVRPGLMTYGVWPCPTAPPQNPLRPLARWETQIVLIKELAPGATVGYGRTYTTNASMRAAVLPVGYADGYPHSLSNRAEILVRGKRCPVRGSVCMDQFVADVTHVHDVSVGDAAILIGADGNERITVEELAQNAGVLSYELLTGIGNRVHRTFTENAANGSQ